MLKNNLLQTLFQPIISLASGEIFGYEALTRGPEGPLRAPLTLFSEAKRYHRLAELDSLCRDNILRRAHEQKLGGMLFINIDPAAVFYHMETPSGLLRAKEEGYTENRIALEFTMTEDLCRFANFIDLVQGLKRSGYHIACDNTVPGNTAFLSLHNLHPDFIKIDLSRTDDAAAAIQQSVHTIVQLTHAQVIAVGVHTAEQLQALANSGILYAQGNFLAEPAEIGPRPREEAISLLRKFAARPETAQP
ncbi:EAL domain-containing protein [Ethanoligenens harbinense]|uniref:EAL domain-containing protein n=1 Tax=Ethanoligenens harbinense TaxID=253239 RepID=UPI0024189BE4|nr:EAL domain-containing protein [Ethanoligenens harbinense]